MHKCHRMKALNTSTWESSCLEVGKIHVSLPVEHAFSFQCPYINFFLIVSKGTNCRVGAILSSNQVFAYVVGTVVKLRFRLRLGTRSYFHPLGYTSTTTEKKILVALVWYRSIISMKNRHKFKQAIENSQIENINFKHHSWRVVLAKTALFTYRLFFQSSGKVNINHSLCNWAT